MTPGMMPNQPPPKPNPHYPRWVEDSRSTDICHDCAKRTTVQMGPAGKQDVQLPPDPRCPFCKGTGMVARKVIAQNPAHHAAIVGYPVGPDGERLWPAPPTAEEVMKAGYAADVATKIAADEAAKAARGIKPYGELEPANVLAGAGVPTSPATAGNSTSGADPLAPEF